jgi:hypothetical protein
MWLKGGTHPQDWVTGLGILLEGGWDGEELSRQIRSRNLGAYGRNSGRG